MTGRDPKVTRDSDRVRRRSRTEGRVISWTEKTEPLHRRLVDRFQRRWTGWGSGRREGTKTKSKKYRDKGLIDLKNRRT